MDPEVEEIIKKQMDKLPVEVRKLFTDPELGNKIINIGKKNGLDVEQLGTLQLETNLVLLGLVHPDEYQNELRGRLKVDDMKVDNIINDIKREILNGVREKLIETFNEEAEIEWNWNQNLDFIFPKWNDSLFLEETDTAMPETPRTEKTPSTPVNVPTLADIKANAHPSSRAELTTGQKKQNMPTKPSKMTDIISKLIIK